MVSRQILMVAIMLLAWPCSVGAQDSAASDAAIAEHMQAKLQPARSERIVLWADPEVLPAAEASAFAAELGKGLAAIEQLTGEQVDRAHYGGSDVHVFVTPRVTVSHVYGGYSHPEFKLPYLYLNPKRVKNRAAPYLHELTHIVLWDFGSHSLREGFASYVEGRLSSEGIGYNSGVFGPGPRKEVDRAAAKLLAGEVGAKVVRWIGTGGGTDPNITSAQSPETREAFYLLARSFVQHVLDTVDMPTFIQLYRAKDTEAAYRRLTGRLRDEWVASWKEKLAADTAEGAPIELPAGIHESGFVSIGGIRQWVTIDGDSRSNPVVLFIHGGPGNPLSPFSKSLYGAWAKDFTIAQWDQRGAGRTFMENPATAQDKLALERMTHDGIEVAEYLSRHLGQPKVLLVGGSWGSALAVHMIRKRPDLFRAYVGVGQLVEEKVNQASSLRELRRRAAAAQDKATLDAIDALGAPPWSDPRNFGKMRRLTRKYEAMAAEAAPASWWVPDPAYTSAEYEKAYEAGEEYSYIQFVGEHGEGLMSTIDLAALGTDFAVPIYLVQGAEDLVTTPKVSRAWFDTLKAPDKAYVVVRGAGHDPNLPLQAETLRLLKEAVSRNAPAQ